MNQVNVATGLDRAINSGAKAPTSFIPLYFLTDVPLENAMTQLSGEVATGAQRGAFQLTSQFLDTMLDPFVFGSGSIGRGAALGFAAEREGTTSGRYPCLCQSGEGARLQGATALRSALERVGWRLRRL